ncbi:hypothetical protein DLAC_07811 [Tieghemostelium lacteum]|uniref:RNA-binding region RNP-1 domain-containing protein n=1 Tax=Tieghemostelium lacteum TaxID=361077 RepID=A0A151ZAG8_TIELA|nr:hypothetical protein DLAC_07811 [Tieghemostelium lacteum]|eukprot:KYQ90935.1 hypothetical protein DLAC_07811 [Tieghemostelium lacteum]
MIMNDSNKQQDEELSFENLTFGEPNSGEFDNGFHPSHHHPSSLPLHIPQPHHSHLHPHQQLHHQHQHPLPPHMNTHHQYQQHTHQQQQQQHHHNTQHTHHQPPQHNTPPNGKPIIKTTSPNSIGSSLLSVGIGSNPNSNNNTPTGKSSNLGQSASVEKRNKSDKSDRHAVLISSKGDKINLALLLKQLEECGPVRAHHFRERQNFGFVQFLDTESADNAINKLNNREIDSQIITVERIKRITPGKDPRISSVGSPQCSSLPTTLPSMIENKPDSTLVLKNLPFNLKQVQLQEILEHINPSAPQSVNFHFDNIGVFRGMAFVKYRLVEDAVKVFDALNGADVHGRRVRLEYKRKVSKSSEIPQEVLEDEQLVRVLEQLKEFRDDPTQNEVTFSSFTGVQRMYIHNMAEKFKLNHTSIGEEPNRSIIVTKKDPNMPSTSSNTATTTTSMNGSNGMNSSQGFSTTPTSSFLSSSPQIIGNLSQLLNSSGTNSNPNSMQNSLSTTPTGGIGNIISPPSSLPNTTTTTTSSTSNSFNSTIGFNIPTIINTNASSNTNNNNSSSTSGNTSSTGTKPINLLSQSPLFLNYGQTQSPLSNSLNISNNNNTLNIQDSKIGTSWEKSPGNFFTGRINRDRSFSASAISSANDLSTSPSWRKFDNTNIISSSNSQQQQQQNSNISQQQSTFNLLTPNTNTPNNSFSNSFNFSNNFNLNPQNSNSNTQQNNNNNNNANNSIFIPTTPLSSINSNINNLLNNNNQQQQILLQQQQQLQLQQQLLQQQQLQQQSFNLSSPTRQPKGPDGTKGFSDGYKLSRKIGQQSPLPSPAN